MGGLEPRSAGKQRRHCFGDFTLDLEAGFLRRGDEEVALRLKTFEVLVYLVEHRGRLISREELMRAIWRDVAVTDEAITKCVAEIRKAIQDDGQQCIRTVARRGYILAASVASPAVEMPRHTAPGAQEDAASPVEDARAGRPALVKPRIRRFPLPWLLRGAAVLLISGGLLVTGYRTAQKTPGEGAAATDYTQVTNFTDSAFSPAISPDGRILAFIRGADSSTIGGEGDIWVKYLPDGEPVQITHDKKAKMTPVFSPEGDRIAYALHGLMTEPTNWMTLTVSVFGGPPKLLLSNASGLSWIPNVSPPQVMFSEVDAGIHMRIAISVANRAESRTVYSPTARAGMAHRSYLSPDRQHVLVVEMGAGGWLPCRIATFGADETDRSNAMPIGPSPGQCSSAAWSPDGRWMYLTVNTGNGYHIWRQRFPTGSPEQVTFGATEEQEPVFAPDGRSFFASVGTRQSTLWLHNERGDRQITAEGYASLPQFSADGRKLYYLLRSRASRRYVSGELWAADLNTGLRERLLAGFLLTDYRIAPDGNSALFVAIGENGESRVWLGKLDGRAAPRALPAINAARAFFGANGTILALGDEARGGRFVYILSDDGKSWKKALPESTSYVYAVSPDGTAVATWSDTVVQSFPLDGGPPVNVSSICAAAGGERRGTTPPCVNWSQDGRFVYVFNRPAGEVYALPVPRGRALPDLPAQGIGSARDAAALGARIIRERAFVGNDPSVYAYFRLTAQRNIYRVRVP